MLVLAKRKSDLVDGRTAYAVVDDVRNAVVTGKVTKREVCGTICGDGKWLATPAGEFSIAHYKKLQLRLPNDRACAKPGCIEKGSPTERIKCQRCHCRTEEVAPQNAEASHVDN